MEKVAKCPRCPAEAVVKHGDDVSDTRYKLTCPDMAMEGAAATPECPYMRPVRDTALREFRRGA
jgi:hypothetical protein